MNDTPWASEMGLSIEALIDISISRLGRSLVNSDTVSMYLDHRSSEIKFRRHSTECFPIFVSSHNQIEGLTDGIGE